MTSFKEAYLWEGQQHVLDRFEQIMGPNNLLNDVLSFLSHRLLTEEAFIKEYSDASKFHKSKGTEKGTVMDAWNTILEDQEKQAKISSDVKDVLVQEILRLEGLKKEFQRQKEVNGQQLSKYTKDLEKIRLDLAKAKMKLHSMMEQSELAQSSLEKAKADSSSSSKQVSKLSSQMVKTQTEYQKAEEEYQAEQKRFAAFQQEYEKKVSDILKDFQLLDENRLSTIHGSMRRYIHLMEKPYSLYKQTHENLLRAIDDIDELSDIQNFIAENRPNWKTTTTAAPAKNDGALTPRKESDKLSRTSSNAALKKVSKNKNRLSVPSALDPIDKPDKKSKRSSSGRANASADDMRNLKEEDDSISLSPRTCQAIYDYAPKDDKDLPFKAGDKIFLTRIDVSGWCEEIGRAHV